MPAKSPWDEVKGQIYLGDDRFVEQMQARLGRQADDINIPRAQRRGPAPRSTPPRGCYYARPDPV
jgi:putative transposase